MIEATVGAVVVVVDSMVNDVVLEAMVVTGPLVVVVGATSSDVHAVRIDAVTKHSAAHLNSMR